MKLWLNNVLLLYNQTEQVYANRVYGSFVD